MSKLTVIVVGHNKTGKSTIASVIANALREHGFEVAHADQDNSLPWSNGGHTLPKHMLQPRVEGLLAKKTEISVREVSA